MADLTNTTLLSILPSSISGDTEVQASATAVENDLQAINTLTKLLAIIDTLDQWSEPMLSTLAWQYHIQAIEGWALAITDAQKRSLIREAIELHRYKGTRWAVEQIFSILGMDGTVSEWFEYDGDPYKFTVDLAVTRELDETFSDDVLALIDALKNVRSHLDRLRIIPTQSGTTRTAAVAWSATTITVRPPIATEVSASGGPRVGVGCWATSTVTLYPSEA